MRLHFVSHTHWDREWYETFDAFRFRLVQLIDRLIGILEKDPAYRYFLLDGQAIVLEDYLEIKPHRKDKLKKYIEDGRIFVGPWYVLTDEFLVSGETHIRNLLLGWKIMRSFGGENRIGYLPDAFGHIAQMPQILKKSGIPYATFWRGASREVRKSEFFWKAPDGSKVLTLYMPLGYGIAANLPRDEESLVRRIRKLIENLAPFATTSHLLFMNGSDHVEPDPELPKKLEILQKALPEHEVLHSNFAYLFKSIEKEASALPVYEGEWRADDLNYLLGGTLSTRVYLKQKHHECSTLLENWIEPLYTILSLQSVPYPKDFIQYLWKLILQNSPHDSICGCSIDDVHEEMVLRYRKFESTAQKLLEKARKEIQDLSNGDEDVLLIFNPYPYPVDVYLEGEVYLQAVKIQEVDFEISKIRSYEAPEGELFPALELVGKKEVIIPEILESCWVQRMETPTHTLPQIFKAQKYVLGFKAQNLPPLGFAAYRIVPRKTVKQEARSFPADFVMENEFYRIKVELPGSLLLFDKETQKEFAIDLVFEDGADAGDEYDYSPCEQDKIIVSSDFSPQVSWIRKDKYLQSVRLCYFLEVPRELAPGRKRRSEERVIMPITLDIKVYKGLRRVDLDIKVENTARDHRLRVLFHTPFKTAYHFADSHFALLKRENDGKAYPQNGFIFLEDEESVLAFFNRGLREYEVSRQKEGTRVAITLLRAIGWLSREDLLTRKGNGGWSLPTEGSQCLGTHQFQIALLLGKGPSSRLFLNKESQLFGRPPLLLQVKGDSGNKFYNRSFFSCDNQALVLSALKERESEDGIVLRMYNPTPFSQGFNITCGIPVLSMQDLSLLEEEENIISVKDATIKGVMKPFEIKTWGILVKKAKKEMTPHDL